MRALLVCAAPLPGASGLVASLAREADAVIAVDGGGAVCRDAGVLPDVLLGDFDSLGEDVVDEFSGTGVEVVRFSSEKDATDLELAILHGVSRGVTEIVVTAATSGRLDHTLGVVAALTAACDLKPRIVEPDMDLWLMADRGRSALTLDADVGAIVSLMPWAGAAEVSIRGVRWPLDHRWLAPDVTLGISNVIAEPGGAHVTVHRGVALVLMPKDSTEAPSDMR